MASTLRRATFGVALGAVGFACPPGEGTMQVLSAVALKGRIWRATLACAAIAFALLLMAGSAHAAFPGANGKIAFDSLRDEPNPTMCGNSGNPPVTRRSTRSTPTGLRSPGCQTTPAST